MKSYIGFPDYLQDENKVNEEYKHVSEHLKLNLIFDLDKLFSARFSKEKLL